jgi:hypothetical protein
MKRFVRFKSQVHNAQEHLRVLAMSRTQEVNNGNIFIDYHDELGFGLGLGLGLRIGSKFDIRFFVRIVNL